MSDRKPLILRGGIRVHARPPTYDEIEPWNTYGTRFAKLFPGSPSIIAAAQVRDGYEVWDLHRGVSCKVAHRAAADGLLLALYGTAEELNRGGGSGEAWTELLRSMDEFQRPKGGPSSFFEELMTGMGEALAHARGEDIGAVEHVVMVEPKPSPPEIVAVAEGKRRPGRRGPSLTSEADRFWRKVDRGDGCWPWEGAVLASGYGKFWTGPRESRRCELAHRVAWHLTNGPIPAGMQIDHVCFNKACVNPAHLEPVTPKINSQRAVDAGRRVVSQATHCKRGHEFTPENTHIIPKGWRVCRSCRRLRKAARLVEVTP